MLTTEQKTERNQNNFYSGGKVELQLPKKVPF